MHSCCTGDCLISSFQALRLQAWSAHSKHFILPLCLKNTVLIKIQFCKYRSKCCFYGTVAWHFASYYWNAQGLCKNKLHLDRRTCCFKTFMRPLEILFIILLPKDERRPYWMQPQNCWGLKWTLITRWKVSFCKTQRPWLHTRLSNVHSFITEHFPFIVLDMDMLRLLNHWLFLRHKHFKWHLKMPHSIVFINGGFWKPSSVHLVRSLTPSYRNEMLFF